MDPHGESDKLLMRAAAGGDRGALDTLLRRHATPVLTFIQRMIGDRHRAEELFQEVFLAVWVKRGQYTYPRPFRPWLMAIAANKCRADLRRGRSVAVDCVDWGERPADCPADRDPSPAETAVSTETAAMVAEAVGQLPAGQRTVVVLRIWNDLSYAEIAEAADLSEATVRVQMFRGLKTIRKFLEPRMR